MIVEEPTVKATTQRWVEQLVVGLNLCPFAAVPLQRGAVRIVVSDAGDWEAVLTDLLDEAFQLNVADPVEVATTLLVVPQCLQDFIDFNEFLGVAEGAMATLGLEGELQLASFHPAYQFADSEPDEPGNYSNRSPFPVLHLLREADLTEVLDRHPDPAQIYQENIRRLEALGVARLDEMLSACSRNSDAVAGSDLA